MNDTSPIRTDIGLAATDPRPVKLSCRNVWKVFGHGAAEFLATRGPGATLQDLASAKLVGAVRNASVDVREGENFIVMGLSGSGQVNVGSLSISPHRANSGSH